jgi:hypothetical protein
MANRIKDKRDYQNRMAKEFVLRAKSRGFERWTVYAPPECISLLKGHWRRWKDEHKALWVNVPKGFELVEKD